MYYYGICIQNVLFLPSEFLHIVTEGSLRVYEYNIYFTFPSFQTAFNHP